MLTFVSFFDIIIIRKENFAMLELIINEEKDIISPVNFRETKLLGFSIRDTKNYFAKKYDTKKEITLFLEVSNKPFMISEKQEFLNGKMVRNRHTSCFCDSFKIIKEKENNFKEIITQFFIPKNNSFNVKIIEDNKRIVYGTEYFNYVINDGFDNEKEFGIILFENNEFCTTRENFVKHIEGMKNAII